MEFNLNFKTGFPEDSKVKLIKGKMDYTSVENGFPGVKDKILEVTGHKDNQQLIKSLKLDTSSINEEKIRKLCNELKLILMFDYSSSPKEIFVLVPESNS